MGVIDVSFLDEKDGVIGVMYDELEERLISYADYGSPYQLLLPFVMHLKDGGAPISVMSLCISSSGGLLLKPFGEEYDSDDMFALSNFSLNDAVGLARFISLSDELKSLQYVFDEFEADCKRCFLSLFSFARGKGIGYSDDETGNDILQFENFKTDGFLVDGKRLDFEFLEFLGIEHVRGRYEEKYAFNFIFSMGLEGTVFMKNVMDFDLMTRWYIYNELLNKVIRSLCR